MSQYRFVNRFELAADADRAFAAIAETEDWSSWWVGLHSEVLEPGATASGPNGPVGRRQRFWVRAPLGYPIEVVGEFLPADTPRTLRAHMHGHLEGDGTIVVTPAGTQRCEVGYELSVRVTSPWMRSLEPLARPVFSWSHHRVVADALAGLTTKLGISG